MNVEARSQQQQAQPVIFLMGPTASGKTELALAMQRQFELEIISVDSAMVYRGLDIGTAKPAAALLARIPHHLINICEPTERYSAGKFRDDALRLIEEIHSRDKIPLLVGGTGLYFRSLEQGISELPPADARVRGQLEQQAREQGWRFMHERLAAIDPDSARRIHPNDPQRIQRALEVYEITGKTLSEYFAEGRQMALPFAIMKLIIGPEQRQELHQRIEKRFLAMIDAGLLDEVRKLHANPALNAGLPAMRLVGYRQVWRYLDGEIDYEQMLEQGIVATRQLAKRQMTWLRAEKNAHWFSGAQENILDNVLKFLGSNPILSSRL